MARAAWPVGEITAAYRAGATLHELARRYQCNRTTIRRLLTRSGVVIGPVGGRRTPVTGAQVVELRDRQRMSWADIAARTGIAAQTARRLYKAAGGDTTTYRRYLSTGSQTGTGTDQSAGRVVERNRAYGHRAEIVAAWHSGETSTADLAGRWGIGETTIRRWAAETRRADPGRYGPADRPPRGRPGPKPGTKPQPEKPVWTMGEDQQELEAAPLSRLRRPGSPWCTQAEAAVILGVTRHQISRLIFQLGVLQPWYAAGGRVVLRRADVDTVARLAGPVDSPDRWAAARAAVGSPQPPVKPRQRMRRERARSRQINSLPWDQIAVDYLAGSTSRQLAATYGLSVSTVRNKLRERGVEMIGNRPVPARLPYSDAELARRHAAGASIRDLAEACQVSRATIYKRLRTGIRA